VVSYVTDVLEEVIRQARVTPAKRAVADLEHELTYPELVEEIVWAASGLAQRGVGEGDRVALLLTNSVDFVIAAFASLWIGAVFVPLATTDPASRLSSIVSDCQPTVILGHGATDDDAPLAIGGIKVIAMSEFRESPAPAIEPVASRSRPAYMIYTSGTTGTPKGVIVGTRAFVAAVRSTSEILGLSASTVTLCVSPFHFDGSYSSLFTTLYSGGTVIIRPRDALLFARTFFNAVVNEKVTYSGFTPAYLRLLLASPQIGALSGSPLEMIALGGEAIPAADLRSLWSQDPQMRVFNRYGPTETTICVTDVELRPDALRDDTVPIGTPHPGVSFYLINDGTVVEEANTVGELYIGGDQLMDGYWNAPELTARVLTTEIVIGETLYRTGDLAYRDVDGNYVYVDRADRVIKRSGVRISLVELNGAISSLDVVSSAACLTFDDDGRLGIVAFIVPTSDVSALALRRMAGELLPSTMLPDRFEVVETFPINRSNKLDERRLLHDAGLEPTRAGARPGPGRRS
jgi:D-alanine--poly(phosphoribitol) ligase subunit 1